MDHRHWSLVKDATNHSIESRQVLRALADNCGLSVAPLDVQSAIAVIERLAALGQIAPPKGGVNWGHFKRRLPICPAFGFSRGTPIDRYYLGRFIEAVRPEVQGDVVEVGGTSSNLQMYDFNNARTYRGFDLFARAGVELVGDAHDAAAVPECSLDTIIAFNVLEHCAEPWEVVNSFHRWLRPGGKALCMVPSIQRVHRFPKDYWRPLPSGLEQLFETWSDRKLYIYGNFASTLGAISGLCAEELDKTEIDFAHPDYPVASCMIATK